MIQLFKMAYRDLGRNRRRSFFSALALGLGLGLLLLMATTIAGEMRGAMESSILLQSGHLQVSAKTYSEDKTSLAWEDLVENPDQMAAQIAQLPQVKVASPRLFASGIVAAGDQSMGVRMVGIDPLSPASAPYSKGVVSGAFLVADDRDGILIGQPLADKMKLKAGDSVNVLANTSNGSVDQQVFTVRGIYSTHTPGFDQGNVFLALSKAQALTQAQNHASILFVLLKDQDQTNAVAAALQTSQYQVKTYLDLNPVLTATEDLANSYMILLYLIVLAVTATVIVNTLIMAVFERTREIGILSSIGMRSSSIMAMFFVESCLLAIGGIGIGLVLGSLMSAYSVNVGFYIGNLGMTGILIGDRIYGYFVPGEFVKLCILAFVVTLLAALYPARLAARMEPVAALHGGEKG